MTNNNLENSENSDNLNRAIICNSKSYDITDIEGSILVEKLQEIARENGISRFDIYDSDRNSLSPDDIESGKFSGDLLMKIENLK